MLHRKSFKVGAKGPCVASRAQKARLSFQKRTRTSMLTITDTAIGITRRLKNDNLKKEKNPSCHSGKFSSAKKNVFSALQERGKREARLTKTCAGISVCYDMVSFPVICIKILFKLYY